MLSRLSRPHWVSDCRRRVAETGAREPLTFVFIGVAVVTRLVFWAYTGRIFEDAIISLSPARNVWEGVGLTHHISEPRVHSFTSALGELVLIVGEGFGAGYGLTAMRIASLAAAVASIWCAARICAHLRLHWSAQVLLLGYLATDHLHILFGMSGMETQLGVALVLANAWYFLQRRWGALGVATGLAVICRPEFLLWPAIMAVALAVEWWRTRRVAPIVAFAVPAALAALPWLIFATLYYGSPVPHTITVKSFPLRFEVEHFGYLYRLAGSWSYLAESWAHIAPFRQWVGFLDVPVPEALLKATVAVVVALALLGAVSALRLNNRMLAILAFLAGFFAYRVLTRVSGYFMWYLPPFTALLFLFAACGVSWIAQRQRIVAVATACALFFLYAMHLPFTLPLDRQEQAVFEEGIRLRVGEELFALMGDQDAVLLEPLGFIGWAAKNKTIYDVPGLGSPKAFAAFRRHRTMSGMISDLWPTFLALRPLEWDEIVARTPDIAARYEVMRTFETTAPLPLKAGSASYVAGNAKFTIYRLRQR